MPEDQIVEFIRRRFESDNQWLKGNCYYFSVILKARFPKGVIWYDVIYGHFCFQYGDKYYDWRGEITPKGTLVLWDTFDQYDAAQKQRIIKYCIE